jgi:ATP-binding cassette, subfamily C, bacterial CydD
MRAVDPRLLREAPAARRFLLAAGLLGLVSAACIVTQAVALGRIVAGLFLGHERIETVEPELVALAAATVVRAAIAWTLESGGRIAAFAVARELRAKLLSHLLAARPGGVPEMPAGELAAAAVGGLAALDPYFARFLPQLVLSAIVPASIFAWVVWHDVVSAVVMALTLPLIPIFGALIGKVTEERTLRRFATLSHLSAHFLDVVRGLPTLRAFGRGRSQSAAIGAVSDAYRLETMATLRIGFLSALVLELAATMSTAVIAAEIGIRLVGGGIALAPALAVLVLAPEYYGPLRNAAAQFHASANGLAAARRVFALLDLPPAVRVPEHPLGAPDLRTAAIRLERVTLRYPGRAAPALLGLTAVVEPGEHVAVAGTSGAGKTSLLALLLRLLEPSAGRIVAGGVDLACVDPDAWRSGVAWLPQRPRLAAGTVRSALGDRSDAELWRALELAAAASVVAALPAGLDAVLGERTPLSAGEIRRLALARALAAGRPLLLLDEPTTHLDAAGAAAVTRAIAELPRDTTVVFATHDARLVESADRVIDLGARSALEAVA